MNTSALPPASICRANTELAAKDSFTCTPEVCAQFVDRSPSTFVKDAAANTSSSPRFCSCALAGRLAAPVVSNAAARTRNLRVETIMEHRHRRLRTRGPLYTPVHRDCRRRSPAGLSTGSGSEAAVDDVARGDLDLGFD